MKIDGLEIHITVRKNCRRLIMRVREGEITMSVPPRTPTRLVESFVRDRRAWIDAQLARTQTDFQPCYAAGENHLVLGVYKTLGKDVPAGEKAFLRWRMEQLAQLVNALLPGWSAHMGVHARQLCFRQMKSRWGSCQCTTGKITLNAKLALVPPICVEYVLVHELCHLLHPDHSPRFYAAMTQWMPDWQERKRRLNQCDLRPRQGE